MKYALSAVLAAAIGIVATPALAQNAAPANCQPLKQIAQVTLQQASDGRWLVPVSINGIQKHLLLDTSTLVTTVWRQRADEMQLPVTEPAKRPAAAASRGSAATAAATQTAAQVKSFGIGSIQSGEGFLRTVAGKDDDLALGPDVVGVLGLDAVGHFDFEMDFASKHLNFFSDAHCPGQVVYWNATGVAVVPFTLDTKGQMHVTSMLDGKPIDAILSVGTQRNELRQAAARREFDVSTSTAGVEQVSEAGATQYRRRFKSLGFDGLALSNALVYLIDDTKLPPRRAVSTTAGIHDVREDRTTSDIVLGNTLMSRLHVYVAMGEKNLYVTPGGAAPAAPAPAAAH